MTTRRQQLGLVTLDYQQKRDPERHVYWSKALLTGTVLFLNKLKGTKQYDQGGKLPLAPVASGPANGKSRGYLCSAISLIFTTGAYNQWQMHCN